jgi:drug/metabolite transporter (DMT)-like permease
MSQTPSERPPSAVVVNACIAVMCVVWGSTWLVIREGLDDIPPYTSAAVRFVVAGLAMSVLVALFGAKEGGARPATWMWIVLGLTNFAASYGIVYRTEAILPSGLVSLLWGVFPMIMALASHVYLPGERLRGPQWLGFAFGFAGLALLFVTDLRSFGAEGAPAALVLFLSPLVSAVGNILIKKYAAKTSSLLLNRNAMLLGGVVLAMVAGLTERDAPARWSAGAIGSVAYLALFGTVLTFGLYFWLLRFVDAHKMSLIAYVTPAIALTLGPLVRGEPVTKNTVFGAACILLGVVLIVRGKAPHAEPVRDPNLAHRS